MGRREILAMVLVVAGLVIGIASVATCKTPAASTANYPGAPATDLGSLAFFGAIWGCGLFTIGLVLLFVATTASLGPRREEPDEEQGPDSSDP